MSAAMTLSDIVPKMRSKDDVARNHKRIQIVEQDMKVSQKNKMVVNWSSERQCRISPEASERIE